MTAPLPTPEPALIERPTRVLPLLAPDTCRQSRIAPLRVDAGTLVLGMADTADAGAIALAELLTGMPARPVAVDWSIAEQMLDAVSASSDGVPSIGAPSRSLLDPRLRSGAGLVAMATAPDDPASAPPASLGQLLVWRGVLAPAELHHALDVSSRTGDPLPRVLANLDLVPPAELALAIAVRHGRQIATPDDLLPTEAVADLVPEPTCRRHRVLPLDIVDHRLRVAMVDPGDRAAFAALRRHTRLPIEPLVASEPALVDALRHAHREAQKSISVYGLLNRRPNESASYVLSTWQRVALLYLLASLVVMLAIAPIATITVLGIASMAFYTAFSLYKIAAVLASLDHTPELTVSDAEAAALAEHELPTYTVLVPLYKEHQILPRLVAGLANLDYPVSKLDVKLLLEEDDAETVAAARAMRLPSFIDIVVTPDCHPKTKPKSCNYGLLYARGDYTVIFDAEDVPERDQLRKAVAAFRKAPANVVCLQGRLNYYNRDQNLLTRWFTGEYSGWFDLFVPGLDNLNLPIPLGGTSNHFVTDALVELGASDPFNVTEDADLGIRLFAAGYKTATLNSTTFEEANSETFNWIRQRSRWVKGYIQTWLVHMRDPVGLLRAVGLRNFLGFHVIIGGTFFVFLINPVQWALLALWTLTQAHVVREVFPGALFYAAWASFLIGNFTFVYINALAVMRRNYWSLMFAALLSPLYWMLMSVAAWRGLLQLITAPSYWEKTEHGLDDEAFADAVAASNGSVAA